MYLADNSGARWLSDTNELLKPAKVHVFNHSEYQNKGISELYSLLSVLEYIPANTPILKISGRYTLEKNITHELIDADIAAKIYRYRFRAASMSTRCYLVKDKNVYENFIKRTLRETYGYYTRSVGLRSFLRFLKKSYKAQKCIHNDDYTKCELITIWHC